MRADPARPVGEQDHPVVPDDHEFALCLTHDVDRPYKTYQSAYYAVTERDPSHLRSLLPGVNPYWQFDEVMAVERDLGVRSAFYVLGEQSLLEDRPLRDWLRPTAWKRYAGRYDLDDPEIRDAVRRLDRGGWEVGLHGSFESYADPAMLEAEKAAVEDVVGHEVRGVRQHYLNLSVPETWRYHAELGFDYDASLGSSVEYGFRHGYGVRRPFGDAFAVLPLTAMELALPDPGESFDRAMAACEDLLAEARDNDAVLTVLWHPRYFSERDFPGYGRLYRRLIERALELDAWVGPPVDLYDECDLGDVAGADEAVDRHGSAAEHRADGGPGDDA